MDAYILIEQYCGWIAVFFGWWTKVGGDGGGALGIIVGGWWDVGRGSTMAHEVVEKSTVECQGGPS